MFSTLVVARILVGRVYRSVVNVSKPHVLEFAIST